ncbi:hypothetical protein RRG08_060153 [Elysia crispata]|uniref:Uncharacterized protein n=1 Tax=Elysia crispata TaxID=231223 RepID=A0AAE1A0F1_9GAST|nr:hypothetical protein RRG08_060153 [Elysia crispata]
MECDSGDNKDNARIELLTFHYWKSRHTKLKSTGVNTKLVCPDSMYDRHRLLQDLKIRLDPRLDKALPKQWQSIASRSVLYRVGGARQRELRQNQLRNADCAAVDKHTLTDVTVSRSYSQALSFLGVIFPLFQQDLPRCKRDFQSRAMSQQLHPNAGKAPNFLWKTELAYPRADLITNCQACTRNTVTACLACSRGAPNRNRGESTRH